ncbi:NUDIX domain-containing protein [Saccharopolyspora sp. HNM0986]|nr:NUDIX domain-containing protein [Saccharopolyspora sp. HNM0986]
MYRAWGSGRPLGADQLPSVSVIVAKEPYIRCVGAVVHAADGRLLLVQRANEPARGKWSLPGGRVESGETDHSAVRREVAEETGLSVIVGALLGRVVRPGRGAGYEIFDYACRTGETALFPGDDAADAMWADGATFATMRADGLLTEGLADSLRSWSSLPREIPPE